jgi:6-phosphogluconolactonase
MSTESPNREIKVVPDAKAVAAEAAERVTSAAEGAIAERGRFSIALSGGSTPKALYALLAAEPYRSRIDWSKVHILFGDERAVPPDHKDSNFKMADEALLSKVPIPKGQVYRMKGELGDKADQAAMEYGLMLKAEFPDGLDVVLLGMGGDGHTASIFPGTLAVKEKEHRVVGYFAENSSTGKSWRITMTAPFINQAREILVLLAGADKAARLKEVLEGPEDPNRLPIQLIKPTQGKIVWIMDVAAAGMSQE